MKIKNLKTGTSLKSEKKIQTVEMIAYFESDDSDRHIFWANFKMEDVRGILDTNTILAGAFEGFRNKLYTEIVKMSLNPDPTQNFYSAVLAYLCGDEIIQKSIEEYPQGGTAIIGHINVQDEALSTIHFVDPVTFKNHLKKDYSIVPCKNDDMSSFSESREVDLTFEELMFLAFLVEMIRLNDHQCCHFSNEEILKFTPIPNLSKRWVAETLGKLQYNNLIDVFIYNSNGVQWFRDILIKDFERCNHIQFGIGNKVACLKIFS